MPRGSVSVVPGGGFGVAFVDQSGRECSELLGACRDTAFEHVRPARGFTSFCGQSNFPACGGSLPHVPALEDGA